MDRLAEFCKISNIFNFLPTQQKIENIYEKYSSVLKEIINNHSKVFIMFYADWCPHCKTAKPAWDEIKTQYENKTIINLHFDYLIHNPKSEWTRINNS